MAPHNLHHFVFLRTAATKLPSYAYHLPNTIQTKEVFLSQILETNLLLDLVFFVCLHLAPNPKRIYMTQCSQNTAISLSLEAAFGPRLPRGKKPNIDFLSRSLSNISFCQMHILGISFKKKKIAISQRILVYFKINLTGLSMRSSVTTIHQVLIQ